MISQTGVICLQAVLCALLALHLFVLTFMQYSNVFLFILFLLSVALRIIEEWIVSLLSLVYSYLFSILP